MANIFANVVPKILNYFMNYPTDKMIDDTIKKYEDGGDHPDPAKNVRMTCELNLPGARYACRNRVKVYACEMTGEYYGGNGRSRTEPCS
ncbi:MULTISPECIES: hypothetical protein [Methylobacterium]|uniref:hypothetical protein n=1 Tax=Methylobacterium TaxID=407 RepID=UPI0013EA2D87|nr:hypothetical protein [Methylobacterium sp. DB0501]NGM34526.1 hypothetical protein [Methylobacterium sp. DB0501]